MDILGTSDAARVLGVSPDMVRVYERTGRLAALRTAGGVRIFAREEINRFVEARDTKRTDTGLRPGSRE